LSKRYEVQGPFHRRGQRQYWIVFDKIKKALVSTHTRSGDAWNKMSEMESKQATDSGFSR